MKQTIAFGGPACVRKVSLGRLENGVLARTVFTNVNIIFHNATRLAVFFVIIFIISLFGAFGRVLYASSLSRWNWFDFGIIYLESMYYS